VGAPRPSADPGGELGDELERSLGDAERRRGAHFTPAAVADRVAGLAIERPGTVADPTCGGGAMLLAAGRRLVGLGVPRSQVARDLLWGADLDPLATAVTEAAIALWSGTAPGPGHVVSGDTLHDGLAVWGTSSGFDVVIGNPPFQGQLARDTARTAADAARLADRFGPAVSAYVDTAALFLLASVELAHAGGRVALIQPQSTIASRDAGGVRAALRERAQLLDLWAPSDHLFAAKVHVCVPVLRVGAQERDDDRIWADRLADARGVPAVALAGSPTIADLAEVVAGFRDEYYGLVGHVSEAPGQPAAPLVTCGLIGLGTSAWGTKPVRFAKQRWARPDVDVEAARQASTRVASWLDRVQRPKVVVASQTRVLEGAVDRLGSWVPSTPALSVVPADRGDVDRVAAVLCAPPVAAWALRRAVGTGLSPDAIRVSAGLLAAVPLPTDARAWTAATSLLAEGDLDAFGAVATAMYELAPDQADSVEGWWAARRPR
jgi:hypothetical protein